MISPTLIMALVHRANTTVANKISNISVDRFTNITDAWGGYSNSTTLPPDWGTMLWHIANVYPDSVGVIAWFILFSIPFIMMWISHSDMTAGAIVGIFFGLYIFAYIGNQYMYYAIAMVGVALAALIWSMWRR